MHLDHGDSFELAMQALRTGYTSIMIDGSHDSFEDNIALTRRVTDACAPSGVLQQAKEFVERTGVDSLAVAIGTTHGLYKGVPRTGRYLHTGWPRTE